MTQNDAQVREAIVGWYRGHAERRLPEVVARWASRAGVDVGEVVVREQRKRWGSCDAKGNLRLNWRIVQAPPKLIEYVVAHEVVHLVHAEHGPAFWAALGRVMPDYEARRGRLRDLGPRVEWLRRAPGLGARSGR